MPRSYTSTSVLKIQSPEGVVSQDTRDNINDVANSIESRTILTQIIQVFGLYKAERSRMPIDDVIDVMRRNITIVSVGSGSAMPAFSVQFAYADPRVAQRVTEDLTKRFLAVNARDSSTPPPMALEILDPASLPQRSSFPNIPVIAFLGLVGGSYSGAILAFRTWKILAAAALAGALIAAGIAWFLPKEYASTAVVRITASSPQGVGDNINRMAAVIEGRESLTQVIDLLGLYSKKTGETPSEAVLEKMRRDISILPINGSAFAIRFNYSDPRLAQRVTQELASKFIDLNSQQASSSPDPMRLQVLDPASLPQEPFFPSIRNITGLGLAGGILLGAILAFRFRVRQQVA